MKILIVDDSKFAQMALFKYMREFFKDAEIYTAGDGEEGFEKYKKLKPDYVIIDLLMPKMSGQQLIKLIDEHYKNHKIFVVSADVQEKIKKEMESFGIIKFINKPFNKEKAKLIYDIIKEDMDEKE